MNRPIVILGAGGHGRVVADALLRSNRPILGMTDIDLGRKGELVLGIPVLGTDDEILEMRPEEIELTVGIGSVKSLRPRAAIFERFIERYRFVQVVHPAATVAPEAQLGDGVQVMAGAVIQTGASIGQNVIVNTQASIDHDCELGDHVHVAPGSTLSGGVRVGARSHIGVGSTILQGITIGKGCVVAAGAVVIDDLPDGTTFIPRPGR